MKRFLSLLATGALALGLSTSASAQIFRAIGAGALTLDDNHGNTLTIQTPVYNSAEWLEWQAEGFPNLWILPIPPAAGATPGFIYQGPLTGNVVPDIAYWIPPGKTSISGSGNTGGATGAWDYATETQLGIMTNPMTTTGDMIYSNPGSTPVRLAIGTTGQFLQVSGGLPAWESTLGVANGGTGSNLSATGGTSEVLLQTTVGGNVTVRQLAYADISGLGTMAEQNANAVDITGGTIDGTTIGGTTPAAGSFTTLSSSGNTDLATGASTQVGIGLTNPVGQLSNTSTNPIMQALGIASNGLNWENSSGGWTAIFNNNSTGVGFNGVGITIADQSASSYAFYIQSNGVRFDVRGNGEVDIPSFLTAGIVHNAAGGALSSSAVNLASADVTGTLPIANGGTNGTATPTNGGVAYGTGTAYAFTGAGSTGQILQSAGAASPAWSTATYPATAGTTGTLLTSNGTNIVNTTATYPAATTINQLLYSSAANTVTGLATGNNGVLITGATGAPSISSTLPTAVQGNITSVGTLTSGSLGTGFTPVGIAQGGTNANGSTYTTNGAAYYTGTAITTTAAGTTGQVLVGTTGSAPSWTALSGIAVTSITGTTNEITASPSTGAVTLSLPATLVAPGTFEATTSIQDAGLTTAGIVTNSANGTLGTEAVVPLANGGTNANLSTSGGAHEVLEQFTNGGAVTVGQLANTDISGLGTMSTQNANAVAITGGSITGTTISGSTGSFTTLGASTSETFSNLTTAGIVTNTALGVLGTEAEVPIAQGGTNANGSTYTTNGAVYYTGTAITTTAAGTTGQVLVGTTGSAPSWTALSGIAVTSITGTTNEITASPSTGAVTLSLPATLVAPGTFEATTSIQDAGLTTAGIVTNSANGTLGTEAVVPVANGGTGDATLTQYGVLLGNAANPINVTAVGTTGTVLLGNTGANPSFGSVGTGDITPGADNTFLTTNNGGAVGWNALAVDDVTLTGNGSNSALAINLANANTWTAQQIFQDNTANAAAGRFMNTFANLAAGNAIGGTISSTGAGAGTNTGLVITVQNSTGANQGLTFAVNSGSGTHTDIVGTGDNWQATSAGAITATAFNGGTGSFTTLGATTSETFTNLSTAGIVTNTSGGVLGTVAEVPVANGGTGDNTLTQHGVLLGEGTGAVGATSAGTANQILTSGGPSADPGWTTLSNVAVTTFQTSLSGLTPQTATSGVVTLAGTLGETSGGTGTGTAATTNGVVYGGASTYESTAASTAAGQFLYTSASGGAPSFDANLVDASNNLTYGGNFNVTTAGAVSGVTTLDAGTSITDGGLTTAGGVDFNNGSGLLQNSANFTWAGGTGLTIAGVTNALIVSAGGASITNTNAASTGLTVSGVTTDISGTNWAIAHTGAATFTPQSNAVGVTVTDAGTGTGVAITNSSSSTSKGLSVSLSNANNSSAAASITVAGGGDGLDISTTGIGESITASNSANVGFPQGISITSTNTSTGSARGAIITANGEPSGAGGVDGAIIAGNITSGGFNARGVVASATTTGSGSATGGAFSANGSSSANIGGTFSATVATAGRNTGGTFTASGATTANNAINITAGALALNGAAGTSGQLLTSAGPSTLPTWTTLSSAAVTSATGTANEVLVNGTSGTQETGAITLTTPQPIGTTSDVQFAELGLGQAAGPDALDIYEPTGNGITIIGAAGSDISGDDWSITNVGVASFAGATIDGTTDIEGTTTINTTSTASTNIGNTTGGTSITGTNWNVNDGAGGTADFLGNVTIGEASDGSAPILSVTPSANGNYADGIAINPTTGGTNFNNLLFFRNSANNTQYTWFVGRLGTGTATANYFEIGVQGLSGMVGTTEDDAAMSINPSSGNINFGGNVAIGGLTTAGIVTNDGSGNLSTTAQVPLSNGGTAVDNTNIAPNVVFAGPASGGAGDAGFRALVDADLPSDLSTEYIQNTNSQQASSNFNISGNGTIGGTLNTNTIQSSAGLDVNTTPSTSTTTIGNATGQTFVQGSLNANVVQSSAGLDVNTTPSTSMTTIGNATGQTFVQGPLNANVVQSSAGLDVNTTPSTSTTTIGNATGQTFVQGSLNANVVQSSAGLDVNTTPSTSTTTIGNATGQTFVQGPLNANVVQSSAGLDVNTTPSTSTTTIGNATGGTTVQGSLTASGTVTLSEISAGAPTGGFLALNGTTVVTSNANVITGSGTQYTIPEWNNSGGTTLGNSLLTDNTTNLIYNGNFTVSTAGAVSGVTTLTSSGATTLGTGTNLANTFGSGGGATSSNTFGNVANLNNFGTNATTNFFGGATSGPVTNYIGTSGTNGVITDEIGYAADATSSAATTIGGGSGTNSVAITSGTAWSISAGGGVQFHAITYNSVGNNYSAQPTDYYIKVTNGTGVSAPAGVAAGQKLVITNATGANFSTGDFAIPDAPLPATNTWNLIYDGSAWQIIN